jgi:Fe-S cluster biosynthesis and repair protein YggX
MTQVPCSRCGRTAEGLERPPLPGRAGERVLDQVCSTCWAEWKGVQVKLINEYRIDLARPESYERLIREMSAFLNLREDG